MNIPVARDHGVYFGELAYVSQEVEEGDALEPVKVVQHLDVAARFFRMGRLVAEPSRWIALEVHLAVPEEPVDLARYSLDVPRELLWLQRCPLRRPPRWIAYAPCRPTHLPSAECRSLSARTYEGQDIVAS